MGCSIDGCDRPLKARSMCDPHYRRVLKYGQPERPERTTEDRLLPRIDFDDLAGCWVWMQVDHLCLNKLCVNPDHLELVTPERHGRRSGLQRWHGQTFWPDVEG